MDLDRSQLRGGSAVVLEGGDEYDCDAPRRRDLRLPGPSPRLGDKARAAMRLRHLSPRTQKAYLRWMHCYYEFHGRRCAPPLMPSVRRHKSRNYGHL
jgi:hypothetical protein